MKRRRIAVALAVGVAFGAISHEYHALLYAPPAGDFTWPLVAARNLLAGRNPYDGPFPPGLNAPYPLPAVFVAVPFSLLPDLWGGTLFFAICTGLLAYALTEDGTIWRHLIFLSAPYYEAMTTVQWSPLFALMVLWVPLLPFALIKPNLGIPLAFADWKHWSRGSVAASLVVLAASVAVLPSWPLTWLSGLGNYGGIAAALVLPAGPLLLLSAGRWHDYETRLLLLMAVFPRRVWYDQLPLMLIARSTSEMLFLCAAGWAGYFGWRHFGVFPDWPLWMVPSVYLPALILVLRRWVNETSQTVNAA